MFSYWIIEGEYEDGCFGELVVAERNTNSLNVMNMVQLVYMLQPICSC